MKMTMSIIVVIIINVRAVVNNQSEMSKIKIIVCFVIYTKP